MPYRLYRSYLKSVKLQIEKCLLFNDYFIELKNCRYTIYIIWLLSVITNLHGLKTNIFFSYLRCTF